MVIQKYFIFKKRGVSTNKKNKYNQARFIPWGTEEKSF
jgi:hypothetical protein